MPPTIEHRASPRAIPVNDPTYVQLMEGDGMPITRGRLLNVGPGGALIFVERVGEPNRPLWIRLERAPETGWIEADVARFERPQEIAIRFRAPCPLEFFLAVVLRADPGGPPAAKKGRHAPAKSAQPTGRHPRRTEEEGDIGATIDKSLSARGGPFTFPGT
jgi:hypothetical protein